MSSLLAAVVPRPALPPLRPHQVDGMARMRAAIAAGMRSIMLAAPTGAGKTRIGAEVIDGALRKGKRVLFVVPAIELVDQTVEALEAQGIAEDDIGVMQGDHMRTDARRPVQVASVQTLQRRNLPAFDVLVIDEAHRWFVFFVRLIADAIGAGKVVIGLSATPWAKGLGKHFREMITVATTQELIEAGYLSRFRVFAPSHPDLKDVRTIAGDYHEGDLSEAMDKPELTADIVSTWLARAENRPTLCFAVDRAHAKKLQLEFDAAGVSTGYIDSYTGKPDRAAVKRQFHTGEIKVVCNVGCLTTGVDWDVRCVVLARPTKSEILFVQIIGRGLRAADGKDDCLILDHSDTHLRLGFVTDIHHPRLDDGKRVQQVNTKPKPKPRDCPKCHYVRSASVHTCPSCGFTPERQADVVQKDGELIELGAARKGADRERKVSVYAQLRWIAKARNYGDGWVSHKYRDYFGFWPSNLGWVPPTEPQQDVTNWVKSRQIAYAKAGGAHARRRA